MFLLLCSEKLRKRMNRIPGLNAIIEIKNVVVTSSVK